MEDIPYHLGGDAPVRLDDTGSLGRILEPFDHSKSLILLDEIWANII
jgi:hypothetical protein